MNVTMLATCPLSGLQQPVECTCRLRWTPAFSSRAAPGTQTVHSTSHGQAWLRQQSNGCRAGRQRQRASATEQDQQASPADETPEQNSTYGEADFLLRLAAVSFAGAAVVKYGELLLGNIPFSHDLRLALVMIFGPCIVYSLMLANRSKS